MTAAIRRCAIYTRKSSEEGLEQAFNSLDAQREACEAYIRSQAHEGWKLVKTAYDDGGFSGGSMERPAVKRLMADLKQGLIDVVVVYKVDRLTRSLADFAKIVEILDGHGASFVSITQQFNTTTSMGRLTLNVLLSFAQFEREVTGERIRDKIAASKRKGMWMGGNVPLGYDVKERQLIPNAIEAETVRLIFTRYLELGCLSALTADLRHTGVVSKIWVSRAGSTRGGQCYSRGAVHYLLRNEIYSGRVPHKGASYPGQHPAIVEQDLWDRVQAALTGKRSDRTRSSGTSTQSLLAGLLHDDRGNLMSPSHALKKGRRYRYYVSQALLQGRKDSAGTVSRVSAPMIEELIERQARGWIPKADQSNWGQLTSARKREQIVQLIERVTIAANSLEIKLSDAGRALVEAAGLRDLTDNGLVRVEVIMKRARGGQQMVPGDRIVVARPERALLRAVARANDLRDRLERGGDVGLHDLAREDRCTRPYVSSMIRLAYLAPDIIEAILQGNQPVRLSLADLTERHIPLDWKQQRRTFGFL